MRSQLTSVRARITIRARRRGCCASLRSRQPPMIILAVVRATDVVFLRSVLSASDYLRVVRSTAQLLLVTRQAQADVLIVDSRALRDLEQSEPDAALLSAIAGDEAPPLVLFITGGDDDDFRHQLLRLGPVGLIVGGVDSRSSVRSVLLQAASTTLHCRVRRQLATRIGSLDGRIQHALSMLFANASGGDTVRTIVVRSGVPRRNLDRQIARAGLAPARNLIAAARTLRAYRLLRDRRITVSTVVREMHYASSRALAADTIAAVGVRPKQLKALRPDELVRMMTHRLTRLAALSQRASSAGSISTAYHGQAVDMGASFTD